MPNTIVTIENATKGGSDTRTTDISGYYVYDDLTQLPNSYETGDLIRISIHYPENRFSTFIATDTPEEKLIL